jgi:hypothetical protein
MARAVYGLDTRKAMNTLDPMERVKQYFRLERAYENIRDEIRKDMEIPLTLPYHEYQPEEEYINGYETEEMLTISNMLANTKELGINKKSKWNYITDLFTRGIKVIKSRKG